MLSRPRQLHSGFVPTAATKGQGKLADDKSKRSLPDGVSLAAETKTTAWHALETRPGHYDFTPLARACDHADASGGAMNLDLLNFEWPHYLDITRREFVDAFVEFAEATVQFLASRPPLNVSIIPVHQISLLASAAGDFALLPPYLRSMGGLVQRQLAKAAIRASKIVRAKLPAALLLSVEPIIDTVLDEALPGDHEAAERRIFETWDMLTGRICPELGGRPEYLNIICVRIFQRHPWLERRSRRQFRPDDCHKPFHKTVAEIHARYNVPLLLTRAPLEHGEDAEWAHFVERELAAVLHLKVPLVGINFHPDDSGLQSLSQALDHQQAFSIARMVAIG